MPPVNSQGSKAGLITTLVISVVLLMVTLIMWIYTNTQWTKAENEAKTLHSKYDTVVSGAALTQGGDVELLKAAQEKLGSEVQGNTAVDVAVAEIRRLTSRINGTPSTNFDAADTAAQAAISKAEAVFALAGGATTQPATRPGVLPPLVAELDKLTTALALQQQANKAQSVTLAQVKTDLDTRAAGWTAQYDELKKNFDAEHKRTDDAQAQTMAAKAAYDSHVAEITTGTNQVAAQAGGQVLELQKTVNTLTAERAAADKKIKDLSNRIPRANVKDAAVRQADGAIVRVPSNNVVYINLGQGDHLPVGITFEVYDKNEGVPGLGAEPTADVNLPVGKASIEVVRVGQNSSECRVVHMTPGVTLSEGDVIANLIYDRNLPSKFVVYGKFDVDGNKVWTSEEGDVIRSLVTRWGGSVQDHLTAETDFVVVGKEPEVPALTKEEKEDPVLLKKFEDALKDSKDYNDLLGKANELHIPVMNQNRFMYYIGYFDQLKR